MVRRDFDCRPPPRVWALTAGPEGALLARRLVLEGASSPVTAADPWLPMTGLWLPAAAPGCWAPPTGPERRSSPTGSKTLISRAGALAALLVGSTCGTGVSP